MILLLASIHLINKIVQQKCKKRTDGFTKCCDYSCLLKIESNKLLQVSSEGRNVNLAFFRLFK